jgi:hypothetical protein
VNGVDGLRDSPGGFVAWLDVDMDDVNVEVTERPVGNQAYGFASEPALAVPLHDPVAENGRHSQAR